MLKKIGIALIIIILISIGVKFFTLDKGSNVRANLLLKYIPKSAAIILETDNLQRGISQLIDEDNNLWHYLNTIDELNKFHSELTFLDSLFNENENVVPYLSNNITNIALHYVGKNEPEVLYLITKPKNKNKIPMDSILHQFFKQNCSFTSEEYENTRIWDMKARKGNEFFIFETHEAIIFSSSEILLEETIRKKGKGNQFADDKIFNKLYNQSNKKAVANIYINNQNFPDVLSSFSTNFISFSTLKNFAPWYAFDLILEDDAFVIEGSTFSDKKLNNYITLFETQKALKSTNIEVFPENTAAFISVKFSDIKTYNQNYKKQLGAKAKLSAYNSALNSIKEITSTDFEAYFNTYIDKEITMLYSSENNVEEPIFIINLKEEDEAQEKFNEIIEKIKEFHKNDTVNIVANTLVTGKNTIQIYHLDILNPFSILYGSLFRSRTAKYYAFFNEYLLVAPSVEKIENLVSSYSKNKLFVKTQAYDEVSKQLEAKSNIVIFSNPILSKKLYYYLLNKKYAKLLKQNEKKLNKLKSFCIDIKASENSFFKIGFDLAFDEDKKPDVEKNWTIKLDTLVINRPQLLRNHYNGTFELFVQDQGNTIYQIDREGKILFKRTLDSPIVGEVKQIDYYTNTKLQTLFVAGNKLYLIDRNGENVEHFPVTLPAKATSSVAVFDYEKDRKYRYFVATSDKKVYAFDKEGKMLTTWNFQAKSIITHEPKHIRIENNDYIVLSATEKLYIQNRKGEERVKFSELVQLCEKSDLIFENAEIPYLLGVDLEGNLVRINFDGTVKRKKLEDTPLNFYLLHGKENNKNRFVVAYAKTIKVFDEKLVEIYDYSLKSKIKETPTLFSFSNNRQMIGVNTEDNKIHLFDMALNPNELFPLQGTSSFVITNPETTEAGLIYSLIVGSENGGLINYKIED